jgi:hypothetical protein
MDELKPGFCVSSFSSIPFWPTRLAIFNPFWEPECWNKMVACSRGMARKLKLQFHSPAAQATSATPFFTLIQNAAHKLLLISKVIPWGAPVSRNNTLAPATAAAVYSTVLSAIMAQTGITRPHRPPGTPPCLPGLPNHSQAYSRLFKVIQGYSRLFKVKNFRATTFITFNRYPSFRYLPAGIPCSARTRRGSLTS